MAWAFFEFFSKQGQSSCNQSISATHPIHPFPFCSPLSPVERGFPLFSFIPSLKAVFSVPIFVYQMFSFEQRLLALAAHRIGGNDKALFEVFPTRLYGFPPKPLHEGWTITPLRPLEPFSGLTRLSPFRLFFPLSCSFTRAHLFQAFYFFPTLAYTTISIALHDSTS